MSLPYLLFAIDFLDKYTNCFCIVIYFCHNFYLGLPPGLCLAICPRWLSRLLVCLLPLAAADDCNFLNIEIQDMTGKPKLISIMSGIQ